MREASPNQFCTSDLVSGSQRAAKSLFWNILAASPCGSRFCGDSEGYPVGKFFWVNILGESAKKNWRLRSRHIVILSKAKNLCTLPAAQRLPTSP